MTVGEAVPTWVQGACGKSPVFPSCCEPKSALKKDLFLKKVDFQKKNYNAKKKKIMNA